MDSLDGLPAFIAVVEARSFSAAARQLGLTTAAVSKAVIRLEDRLGVRLFTRTTRRVVPTPEGEGFYLRARDILDRLADAEAEVKAEARGLSGRVSIAAPVLIGCQRLAPLLAHFRRGHPDVILDLRLDDALLNVVESGIDLALRLGDLDDSRLVARRLRRTRFTTCASPEYLARHGTPGSIEELRAHTCVSYVVQRSGKPFPWHFSGGTIFVPTRSVMVGDGGGNRAFAAAGLGLIQEIDVAVRGDLESGVLVEVLAERSATGPPLSLVQPAGRFVPQRTRALIDYLVAELSS